MKSTGVIRKVDELGRIVLSVELRRSLDIQERDELEVLVDDDKIILRKYECSCLFCGGFEELKAHMGKYVCAPCARKLNG